MRLNGTRVLLTGASTGIGRQLGRALAQRGAVLAVAARRRALLDELAAEIAAVGGREPVRLSVATQSLRLELRGTGVDVLEVLLGPIDTSGSRENRMIEGAEKWLDWAKPGGPEKAAIAIARAIERGRRRLIYPRRMSPSYHL